MRPYVIPVLSSLYVLLLIFLFFFFFNDPATTEIYTLSLHDALPILQRYHDVISSFGGKTSYDADNRHKRFYLQMKDRKSGSAGMPRPISYAVFCLKKKKKKKQSR